MVTTRTGDKTASSTKEEIPKKRTAGKEATSKAKRSKKSASPPSKVKPAKESPEPKPSKSPAPKPQHTDRRSQIQKVLQTQGALPLESSHLKEQQKPTPETVLAHLLNALISSARISHAIASKTVEELIKAGYDDLDALTKSSWNERTVVLTDGGYTRYREKTATALGEMAEHLNEKYGGDASRLIAVESSEGDAREVVAKRVKEFKGIGDLGAEVFLETVQAVVPQVAPAMSKRDLKEAEKLGFGTDVKAIFEDLDRDAVAMAKLCQALTRIRLEGKEPGIS